jgi:serine/threonine protein kinase
MHSLQLPAQLTSVQVSKELSQGGQAKIYLGMYNEKQVAVKVFLKNDKRADDEFCFISKLADCPHVMNAYALLHNVSLETKFPLPVQAFANQTCMMSELCRCDLYSIIEQKGAISDTHLLKGLFAQVVSAVDATHKAGICHLDIKLENFLVSQEFNLKLCDYGFAALLNKPITTVLGTEGYMAPEVANEHSHYDGAKADIFSMGVLLYTMAFGNPPFGSTEDRFYRLLSKTP